MEADAVPDNHHQVRLQTTKAIVPASVTRTNKYMQANAQHIASVQANVPRMLRAVGQARSRDRALVC